MHPTDSFPTTVRAVHDLSRCVIRSADHDVVITTLHASIDRWEAQDEAPPCGAWCFLRLFLHEWVANLVQHADFVGLPAVTVTVWRDGDDVCGLVRDNSRGFELERHLDGSLEDVPERLPARGMGLLLMHDAARVVDYRRGAAQGNHLSFRIAADATLEPDPA